MTEQFYNGAQWTLRASVSSSDTTLPWTSFGVVSATPTFRLIIGSEIVIVTSVAFLSTSFDVTRGAEGTTAVAHSVGEVATAILTAGALAQFQTDTVSLGAQSAGAISQVQVSDGAGGFTAPGGVRAGSEFLAFGTASLLPVTGSLRFAPGSGFATVRNISNSDDKTLWKHEVVYGGTTKEHLYLGCDPFYSSAKSYDVLHHGANELYEVRIAGTSLFTIGPVESVMAVSKTTWGPVNSEVISALPSSVITTNDATPTNLVSLSLKPDSLYDVIVTVVGKRAVVGAGGGGTAGDCYRADLSATYQRIGSAAASFVGAAPVETNKKSSGGGSAYSATLTTTAGAGGSSLNVEVTGVATTDIYWSALVRLQRVA